MIKYIHLLSLLFIVSCSSSNLEIVSKVHTPEVFGNTANKEIKVEGQKIYKFKDQGIWISNKFKGARIGEVKIDSDQSVSLTISPENAPINDSAWYSLQLGTLKGVGEKQISLKLNYKDGHHRYHPKISRDGKVWTRLDSESYQIHKDTNQAVLKLTISEKPLWISAQELWTTDVVKSWLEELSQKVSVKLSFIGKTNLGADIPKLTITNKESASKYIVLLSRQHPPEVSGQMALKSFLERVTDDSKLSNDFLDQYQLIVLPHLNPDGVDQGHWRHNYHGVDLNRDWKDFNQIETRLARNELSKLKGRNVIFAIDFHSTTEDIFYVLKKTVSTLPKNLGREWIAGIAKTRPQYQFKTQSVDNTISASMAWLNKEFGVSAVTYEVGDATDRKQLHVVAQTAAEVLMELLLNKKL